VDRYEIPDRLRDQVDVTFVRCVHPNCTRRARKADRDHVIAHAEGGTTCSCNLAPLRLSRESSAGGRDRCRSVVPGWAGPTGQAGAACSLRGGAPRPVRLGLRAAS
jgi:hypothetical protein